MRGTNDSRDVGHVDQIAAGPAMAFTADAVKQPVARAVPRRSWPEGPVGIAPQVQPRQAIELGSRFCEKLARADSVFAQRDRPAAGGRTQSTDGYSSGLDGNRRHGSGIQRRHIDDDRGERQDERDTMRSARAPRAAIASRPPPEPPATTASLALERAAKEARARQIVSRRSHAKDTDRERARPARRHERFHASAGTLRVQARQAAPG